MCQGSPSDGRPIDQVVALGLQLAATAGNEPPTSLLEIRSRKPGGPMRQTFFPIRERRAAAAEILSRAEHEDVYWGVNPRACASGRTHAVERCWSLFVDADTTEAVEATLAFAPAPSLVVLSGRGGLHAYWPLSHPVSAADCARGNRRLAHHLGADIRATDAARILRPAGTLNHKTDPPRPVECVQLETAAHAALDVVGQLPEPVAPRAPAPLPARDALGGDDPLKRIPAPVYIASLTGREIGHDRKARCPFHSGGEERTPSLHVYDEGWYCFGCGRGGSILDFGAALYDLEPRSRDFHEIRRRLAADLLIAMGEAA